MLCGEYVYCAWFICFYPVYLYILATSILLSSPLIKICFFRFCLLFLYFLLSYLSTFLLLVNAFAFTCLMLWSSSSGGRPVTSCFSFFILFSLLKSVDGNLRAQRLGDVCIWCTVFLLRPTNRHRLRQVRVVPFNSSAGAD